MESIHGTIDDSEDNDDENEVSKPKRIGPQLAEIKRLMAVEGIDYEQAYNRIFNPKPKEEPTPTPTPQPQPLTFKNLNDIMTGLNSHDIEKIDEAYRELDELSGVIGKENADNIALSVDLQRELNALKSIRGMLENQQKEYEAKEQKFKADTDKLVREASKFHMEVTAHKKRRRGYVKKITKDALKEFEG